MAAGASALVAAMLTWASCGGGGSPRTPPATPATGAFDLEEATIADLQQRMEGGQDTARSLVEKYTARIEQLDRQGPALRSVIELNPEALTIADRLDEERKQKGARGPLHGIPILVKDNIATADRMTTTAGSLALEGVIAPRDAFVASRLRDAGAVILGKTNLSEWANFRSTHSSSGWSARGGQTRNPYALDRSPCGSSSGSAVAVAANLAAAAIGTETDGSIVCPAHSNSLIGLKPTLGLVSRTGIVPIAHSQDTAGPITRTVADAAVILAAIDGVDRDDPATEDASSYAAREYLSALDPNGLQGARIGIVRDKLFGYSPAADRLADLAIADMKKQGADRRRSGEYSNARVLRRDRIRRAALRIQGRPEQVPGVARSGLAGPLAEGRHRVQQPAPGRRAAVLRPGNHGDGRGERTADKRGVPERARDHPPSDADAWHRRGDGRSTSSTHWRRRPSVLRGWWIWSAATRSRPACRALHRLRQSRAIHTSRCRWDITGACR